MQMRAGGAAGRAEPADHLAEPDRLSDPDVDLRQVAVAGRDAVGVLDLDHAAVAAAPAGGRYGAGRGGTDRLAGIAAKIDARVPRRPVEERIDAHAESRARVELAVDRLMQRHRREGP